MPLIIGGASPEVQGLVEDQDPLHTHLFAVSSESVTQRPGRTDAQSCTAPPCLPPLVRPLLPSSDFYPQPPAVVLLSCVCRRGSSGSPRQLFLRLRSQWLQSTTSLIRRPPPPPPHLPPSSPCSSPQVAFWLLILFHFFFQCVFGRRLILGQSCA